MPRFTIELSDGEARGLERLRSHMQETLRKNSIYLPINEDEVVRNLIRRALVNEGLEGADDEDDDGPKLTPEVAALHQHLLALADRWEKLNPDHDRQKLAVATGLNRSRLSRLLNGRIQLAASYQEAIAACERVLAKSSLNGTASTSDPPPSSGVSPDA